MEEQMQFQPKPYKVELTRGAKGQYQWVIRVYGDLPADILDEIAELDKKLKAAYVPFVEPE